MYRRFFSYAVRPKPSEGKVERFESQHTTMTDAVDKLADDVQELKLGALCFLIWLMRIQICRRSLL